MALEITDATFEETVLKSDKPVMVDFWAAWCGPCQVLGPILEDLAADPDSEFILAKLDTEHNRRAAQQFRAHRHNRRWSGNNFYSDSCRTRNQT